MKKKKLKKNNYYKCVHKILYWLVIKKFDLTQRDVKWLKICLAIIKKKNPQKIFGFDYTFLLKKKVFYCYCVLDKQYNNRVKPYYD